MQQALSIAPTLMLLAGIAAAVEMLMKRSSRVSEQAALDLAHALNRLASKEQTTAEGNSSWKSMHSRMTSRAVVALVDSFNALAIESQDLVESTELHALDIRAVIDKVLQDAHVQADLVIKLSAHEPLE